MIVIVDYGLGNINAFVNIYKKLDVSIKIAKVSKDLAGVSKIILPGVGAFDHAMSQLNASGMRDDLDNLVLKEKIPVLGICVGMQILANSSEEGKIPGLGWVQGSVKRFDESKIIHKPHLPHMGWNDVKPLSHDTIFNNIVEEPLFYFLHSYYFSANNQSNILATADYGGEFTCAVRNDNIYGVQFHPEKSHSNGIELLKNFANIN
ncbi:imidazole glycerol phosphate synthase subunit HisH [Lacihabitans sp. CS3-21]|uniref:imidazole glycerol phosphate synthase subunit HisH n=1 Tax=Lacihabitans sp. CS3-21 TaxID=2487332 RepID=UPI0020CB956A|nr:imidazole glycerol phosphate synthase subunit HisH [Lacihabitans sp. CS3-21]MCP9747559.1 imidazole glycerol phosphate synthase subunit HisH [Lacihabitans sp. CS3-21]